ncbi:MAG: GGDEF domain-containing protein [Chloroflexota bacterium]
MSWIGRWWPRDLARTRSFATSAGVVAVGLFAVFVAWTTEGYVQDRMVRSLAAQAVGQLEGRVLADVSAVDLAPDASTEPSQLVDRLRVHLDQARASGAPGLIRVNVYAPDGTVLFSDQPERIGRKVLPSRVPRLSGALAGTLNTRLLALSSSDDADLTGRYTDVLAVYSPLQRDGQIVAAAELYADPTPIRLARLATWFAAIGPVTVGLLLFIRRRQVEQADRVDQLIGDAFFDSLTGLANRALFKFRLEQAFHRAARRRELMVVMYLDLDRFKAVNDTLGHAAGDRLLTLVGVRLLASVRPEDTIARLGGDEFTVLLEEVPSLDDARAIADRILEAMRKPFLLSGKEQSIGVSVGIAARTTRHLGPDDLLHDADVALYRAKSRGRDRYVVYGATTDDPVATAS